MFHVVFSLPALYVLGRFVWWLPWPPAARLALGAAVLVASQFHLWNRLTSGSPLLPEYPRPVVWLLNWAFAAVVVLALLQIATDLGAAVAGLAQGHAVVIPADWRYGLGGVAMVLAALGVRAATRVPPLRDVEVSIPGLPQAFDGYRLVQLTDLHISRLFPRAWARAVVDATNRLGADLVVVTGDLIDGGLELRRGDVAPLADLVAPDGVWVTPGNHEYYFGFEAWMRHYEHALGLRPLMNAHAVLTRPGGARLVLAGVTDLWAARSGRAPPDLGRALAGAPAGVPVILLDHQPRRARAAAARGVALQLSGHTHGGLIAGLDRLAKPANGGFVSRRYDVDGMVLYVNNGTGLWPGMALRLGRPSELTRFTLRVG